TDAQPLTEISARIYAGAGVFAGNRWHVKRFSGAAEVSIHGKTENPCSCRRTRSRITQDRRVPSRACRQNRNPRTAKTSITPPSPKAATQSPGKIQPYRQCSLDGHARLGRPRK